MPIANVIKDIAKKIFGKFVTVYIGNDKGKSVKSDKKSVQDVEEINKK